MNIRTSATRLAYGVALAVAALVAPPSASAQFVLLEKEADAVVRGGFDALYNLRYDVADTAFTDLTRTHPNHPAGYFLLALVDWWRIVPNLDDSKRLDRYSESFHERLDKTIEISDARLDENPEDIVGLFFKGAALGYKARLRLLGSTGTKALTQWVSAAHDATEAYEILNRAKVLAPSNSDILMGSGLFTYMSVAVPEQYPITKPLLNFVSEGGDKQLGLQMLQIASKRAQYASVESKYALMEIYASFEKKWSEVLPIAQELHAKYPGNPVFHRYLARANYATSNFIIADSLYSDIIRRVLARQNGYEMTLARQSLYYLADSRLRMGNLQSAEKLFKNAIAQSERLDQDEEGVFLVLSHLRLGNTYDKLGRRSEAIRQYREVLDMEDFSGTRKKAEDYLRKPFEG